jgi:hypothetical protein
VNDPREALLLLRRGIDDFGSPDAMTGGPFVLVRLEVSCVGDDLCSCVRESDTECGECEGDSLGCVEPAGEKEDPVRSCRAGLYVACGTGGAVSRVIVCWDIIENGLG